MVLMLEEGRKIVKIQEYIYFKEKLLCFMRIVLFAKIWSNFKNLFHITSYKEKQQLLTLSRDNALAKV